MTLPKALSWIGLVAPLLALIGWVLYLAPWSGVLFLGGILYWLNAMWLLTRDDIF